MDAPTYDPSTITRPDRALRNYYLLVAALTLAGFPFVVIPLLIKYHTLRYRFDDDGVHMSWGFFFRREIYLTYRRIQDIHVMRNLLHRWLGLAAVGVQTASGTSGAEMTIEGILNPEPLRDFLYAKMRGARGALPETGDDGTSEGEAPEDEALSLLREIRDSLEALREERSP